ncbi:xylose isomerase, partial [Pilibacter termitis]
MSYFPNVEKIKFEGTASENPFAFRHYNPEEVVLGKTQREHLRFALAYWHTMTQDGSDPFGLPTNQRTWFGATAMETAKNRVDAFFEILEKLDVDYFCFHDI